jgi:hypothetical protein
VTTTTQNNEKDVPAVPLQISLRDYVAAQCLAAATASPELMEVVSSGSILDGSAFDRMAKRAFQQADAFLSARQQKDENDGR